MLPIAGTLPVSKENEQKYLALCSDFKKSNTKTIWSPVFRSGNLEDSVSSLGVSEFYITEITDDETIEDGIPTKRIIGTFNESGSRSSDSLDVRVADSEDNNEAAVLADCISQEKLIEIKDALTKENSVIDVNVLRNIPVYLVENFFNEVNISQATIPAIRTFVDHVLNMDPPIGLNIATAIIRHVLYPRAMKNDSYRNLINMTVSFCEKYSSGVVDGLLILLLQSELFGSFQVEMFTSVFNSMKLQENDYRKIRETLCLVVPSVSMFGLLTFLIGVQNFMDDHAFAILIKKLKEWSTLYNGDLKFSNLLMKVITAYGKKANDEQLSVLEEIVMNNTSSFKMLASRELNKLRK